MKQNSIAKQIETFAISHILHQHLMAYINQRVVYFFQLTPANGEKGFAKFRLHEELNKLVEQIVKKKKKRLRTLMISVPEKVSLEILLIRKKLTQQWHNQNIQPVKLSENLAVESFAFEIKPAIGNSITSMCYGIACLNYHPIFLRTLTHLLFAFAKEALPQ